MGVFPMVNFPVFYAMFKSFKAKRKSVLGIKHALNAIYFLHVRKRLFTWRHGENKLVVNWRNQQPPPVIGRGHFEKVKSVV